MTHARIPDSRQAVPARVHITDRTKPVRIPVGRRYHQFPDETQPGAIEPREAVTPIRPDTAYSRSLRFLDGASELLAAIAIIGGGIVLTGLASLL